MSCLVFVAGARFFMTSVLLPICLTVYDLYFRLFEYVMWILHFRFVDSAISSPSYLNKGLCAFLNISLVLFGVLVNVVCGFLRVLHLWFVDFAILSPSYFNKGGRAFRNISHVLSGVLVKVTYGVGWPSSSLPKVSNLPMTLFNWKHLLQYFLWNI